MTADVRTSTKQQNIKHTMYTELSMYVYWWQDCSLCPMILNKYLFTFSFTVLFSTLFSKLFFVDWWESLKFYFVVIDLNTTTTIVNKFHIERRKLILSLKLFKELLYTKVFLSISTFILLKKINGLVLHSFLLIVITVVHKETIHHL